MPSVCRQPERRRLTPCRIRVGGRPQWPTYTFAVFFRQPSCGNFIQVATVLGREHVGIQVRNPLLAFLGNSTTAQCIGNRVDHFPEKMRIVSSQIGRILISQFFRHSCFAELIKQSRSRLPCSRAYTAPASRYGAVTDCVFATVHLRPQWWWLLLRVRNLVAGKYCSNCARKF
jgi:hypothetical protein